jgi:4-hydroxybenzoate polyprenyltransferase
MVVRPHILAMAGLAALVFGWLFATRFLWVVVPLVVADWFVVNLLNRVVDLDEDARNDVPGTALMARYRVVATAGTALFGLAVLGAGHLVLPEATGLRVVFHAIGAAYNYKVIPWPGGRTRFKEMYLLKNASSTGLFIISVILVPLMASGHAGEAVAWSRAAWLVAFFFPLEMTYEVLFDLRDVKGDAEVGVPTLPVVHGVRGAYLFCAAALCLSALVPLVGYAVGPLRVREAVLAAGAVQQGVALWLVHRRGATGPRVVNVTYMGAAQLASYCLWVGAGLPVFDA